MLAEESDDGSVERVMEGQSVEARPIRAASGEGFRPLRGAARREGEMPGAAHDTVIGLAGQRPTDRRDPFGPDLAAGHIVVAQLRGPELKRYRQAFQAFR